MSTNQKYNFTNKVAIVTGSSSGIGEAIAIQLAQYGAKVTITGRNKEKLAQVAEKIQQVSGGQIPLQVVGDFLTDDALPRKLIDQTIAKFGQLDFLVNNAGAATAKGTLESVNLLEGYDTVFRLNVRSVVELTALAVPHLDKTKGNVVNISSVVAIKPHQLVYSASKAAVDMVTKASALELGPKGIRVNSVNPGAVATDLLRSVGIAKKEQQAAMYAGFIEKTLMKRIGTPEDIANLVSFVVSDDARNITGSTLVSDSGVLLKGM